MEHKTIDSSLKSILSVTIPMVLSIMSTNLMCVIDRIMLAGYSIDSMNAALMSGNFVWIFIMMFVGISDTAEIFTGQYNGSKQYDKLAAPVWQMIYLSLASSVVFLPVAYFSDYINTLPDYYFKEGVAYQKTLMYFGILVPLRVALSAFFIAQGKTKIITVSVTIGTVTNIILDYFFIYGLGMGCKGAAMATVISEFVEIVILAAIFFSKKNRKIYKTVENSKFDLDLLWRCAKVGIPMSLGNFVSMLAWYMVQTAISHVSKDIATIYNIGLNVYMFFIFVGEGINKAIAAICSNMIGHGDLQSIEKTRQIFVVISLVFGLIIAAPLIGFPEWILNMLDMLPDNISALYSDIKMTFYAVTVTAILETLLFSTWGILIAGGDTKYAMIVYQLCLWILVVLPTSVLYYMNRLNSVPMVYMFMVAWLIATQFFLYRRYKSLKWYNKLV